MDSKEEVKPNREYSEAIHITLGASALVKKASYEGEGFLKTSKVIKHISSTGEFETVNTYYSKERNEST